MKRWAMMFLATLVLSGPLWAMKVKTFYSQGADFSQYKTYALAVPEPDPAKDPDGHAKKTWEIVREQAAQTLKSQGLVEAEPDKADLHLIYTGSATVGSYGAIWEGTGGYSGLTVGGVRSYAAGTFVIEFLEPGTEDVIWRGTANPGFGEDDDFDKTLKEIEKTVRKILGSYPPKK